MLLGERAIGTVSYIGGLVAVPEVFTYSLTNMLLFSNSVLCKPAEFIHFDRVPYSDHGPARNEMTRSFMGQWLLQLDTDHMFEPDLLVRMMHRMNTLNLDVLTGIYRFKR